MKKERDILNTKILVIQITRMGDVLQSYPLLKDIKQQYPDSDVHILINNVFCEIADIMKEFTILNIDLNKINDSQSYFIEVIDNINTIDFDIVFNLNNSPIAKNIFNKIKATQKLGFASDNYDNLEWAAFVTSFLKNRKLNTINLVDIFRRFLHSQTNYDKPLLKKEKSIALQCGARNIKRQFEIQHYLDIISYFQDKHYKIYLLGTSPELPLTDKIFTRLNNKNNIENLVGKTSILELKNVINKCEHLFTPDTGTMHLSAFCNTPFTAFFCGPAYPFETLGYIEKANFIMPNSSFFKCYPCNDESSCPYGLLCHKFSFRVYLDGDIQDDFITGKTYYDRLGQNLSFNGQDDDYQYASLWRQFAQYYFFSIKEDEINLDNKLKVNISRELILWNKLKDNNQLLNLVDNFEFIAPLIFFKIILKDSNLPDIAIKFFKDILKGTDYDG